MITFDTKPFEYGDLPGLLNWIIEGPKEGDLTLSEKLNNVLSDPREEDLAQYPCLRPWCTGRDPVERAAAQLVEFDCEVDLYEYLPDANPFVRLQQFARHYAREIRHILFDPVLEVRVAEVLATLAAVLDQKLTESTATFIIETVHAAELPHYTLHALFAKVARTESGRIKPASFVRHLPQIETRLRTAQGTGAHLRRFIDNVEPALLLIKQYVVPLWPASK